ncbi:MAG TPA: alpha-hydroxy-acid oxidizing protein [Candidatus Acidoferrum sp.]|nr:alpha-hydroxy-acid oxidizing protein [Candidatus Acidoferrum sp.]
MTDSRKTDAKKPQPVPTGPERELQLYAQGLAGGKPSVPVPLDLLEQKAKEILAPRAYEAFYQWRIVPRMLRDVAKRDLSVELLGVGLPAPILLGRLYMWGLAVAGEQGVRDVLLNLIADCDLTLALSGYTSCRELDSSALAPSP